MKRYIPLLANVLAQVIFGLAFFFIKMGMAVVDQNTGKDLLDLFFFAVCSIPPSARF